MNQKPKSQKITRSILWPALGALVLVATMSSCSTTIRTDNGHAVTTGVHAN
jgi:hypothetical protein